MIEMISDIIMELTKVMSKKRLCHSVGVMKTAYKLAKIHNADCDKAVIAGILHDYAKEFEHKEMINICKQNNVTISKHELNYPNLLHGKAAACIAKEKYKIESDDLLEAIMYHTTGKPGMSKIAKIIYLADYIEPNREYYDELDVIRKTAETDLDKACFLAVKDCIDYLTNEKKIKIDEVTMSTYEYFANIVRGAFL